MSATGMGEGREGEREGAEWRCYQYERIAAATNCMFARADTQSCLSLHAVMCVCMGRAVSDTRGRAVSDTRGRAGGRTESHFLLVPPHGWVGYTQPLCAHNRGLTTALSQSMRKCTAILPCLSMVG